jgi:glycerol uptake facilitator-like aquaporin
MLLTRKLAAKFIGTFWLVLGGCGALVYRFVTPAWARGPGDPGGPGT